MFTVISIIILLAILFVTLCMAYYILKVVVENYDHVFPEQKRHHHKHLLNTEKEDKYNNARKK